MQQQNQNTVAWESPSNIALVKYWGKKGNQYPCNPSLSMSLKNAVSRTKLKFSSRTKKEHFQFFFEGKRNVMFESKIYNLFSKLENTLPFLQEFNFEIHSENTFPHSTGIASSASGMSALALCLCSFEEIILGKKTEQNYFLQRASEIARLGSGSACRSIYGGYAVWGKNKALPKAVNDFAIPVQDSIHPIFQDFQDYILLINSEKKSVSSTVGHQLMENHPFATVRYQEANQNFADLLRILKDGDLESYMELLEKEALSLHALMINSSPSFILMHGNTIEAIQKIRNYRRDTKIPVCFTLDAGPNIHLLFPRKYHNEVTDFVEKDLKSLLEKGKYIKDETGSGPLQLI